MSKTLIYYTTLPYADKMTYEIWTQILEILARKPDHIFNLDELEEETGLDRQNIQQALYRAYRRRDVERVAPGMYRYYDKYRGRNNNIVFLKTSKYRSINLRSQEFGYEIIVPHVSLQILDEIIGQLKYIRNQIAHK
jgi:predicted transcriptional regulator of viral defense system